ncbi:MAG: hypothetical protein AAGB93_17740 [Planctomycetota bacterium]
MRRRNQLVPIVSLAAFALVLVLAATLVRPAGPSGAAGERVDRHAVAGTGGSADREAALSTPAATDLREADVATRTETAARTGVRFAVRLLLEGRPLPNARVRVQDARAVGQRSDALRWFEAADVGTFRVALTRLPDGVLPPRHARQDPLTLTVSRTDEVVTLEAVRAAFVHGRVTCRGAPASPCHIRVGRAAVERDARWTDPISLECDGRGWYAGWVYPGCSVLSVRRGLAPDASAERRRNEGAIPDHLRALPRPQDAYRTLYAGSSNEVDFAFAEGPRTLEVVLVDRDGAPRPALRAVLFPRSASTDWSAEQIETGMGGSVAGGVSDGHGRVRIGGLLPDIYGLVIEPDGYGAFVEPGATRLAHRPRIHTVDLSTSDVVRTLEVPSPDLRELRVTFVDRTTGDVLRNRAVTVLLEPRFGRDADVQRLLYVDAHGVLRVWIEDDEEHVLLLMQDGARSETYEVEWIARPGPSPPVAAVHSF